MSIPQNSGNEEGWIIPDEYLGYDCLESDGGDCEDDRNEERKHNGEYDKPHRPDYLDEFDKQDVNDSSEYKKFEHQ